MDCIAKANGGKRRCRLPATEGTLCEVHARLLEERGELKTANGVIEINPATGRRVAKGEPPAPPTPPENPDDTGVLPPSGGGDRQREANLEGGKSPELPPDLFALPEDAGPEAEPAAEQAAPLDPPPLPPEDGDGEEGEERENAPSEPPLFDLGRDWLNLGENDPSPTPAAKWKAGDVARFIRWTVQPKLERDGKEALSESEITSGGEALAPLLNLYMGKVDPNSPGGAALLWIAVTFGPRYGPDLLARIKRGRGPLPRPTEEARPPAEEDVTTDGPTGTGGGWFNRGM